MTNSEKALPEVEIDFLGEKKKLVFSTLAFCLLEEITGKNALDGETWRNPDARMRTALVWAGLQTNYPDITLDQVRRSLPISGLKDVMDAVLKAFSNASGNASDEKKTE